MWLRCVVPLGRALNNLTNGSQDIDVREVHLVWQRLLLLIVHYLGSVGMDGGLAWSGV